MVFDFATLCAASLLRIWVVDARLVCKWARPTLRRFNLPLPVTVMRFAVALCVFILLMSVIWVRLKKREEVL